MSFDRENHCHSTNRGTGEDYTRKFIKQTQKIKLKQ